MDQVKCVTTWKFLINTFHKFTLIHSWTFCRTWSFRLLILQSSQKLFFLLFILFYFVAICRVINSRFSLITTSGDIEAIAKACTVVIGGSRNSVLLYILLLMQEYLVRMNSQAKAIAQTKVSYIAYHQGKLYTFLFNF